MPDEPKVVEAPDLNKDFAASTARVEELRAGRQEADIAFHDEYWKALNKHRLAHSPDKEK